MLLILATVFTLGFAASDNVDTETAAASKPIVVQEESRHYHYNDRRQHSNNDHRDHLDVSDLDNKHHDPDISQQNKIIKRVYSPDYHEPIWILDYRYMKSGGRDYVRGPGGQIIILPKNVRSNEHKERHDYDSLIEHLRLKHIEDIAERNRFHNSHHDEDFSRRLTQYNRGRGGGEQRHNQRSQQTTLWVGPLPDNPYH